MDDYPGEALVTVTLVETNGKTKLTSHVRSPSKEIRDAGSRGDLRPPQRATAVADVTRGNFCFAVICFRVMRTQMHLTHLARDVTTALELAIAAFAPSELVDRLALAAGYLDAFQALDSEATALQPLITRTTERADLALSIWRQWEKDHPPRASA